MKWSLQKALGLTVKEAQLAEVRAERIEEAYRPDGRIEYVPETRHGSLFQAVRRGEVARSDNPIVNAAYAACRQEIGEKSSE